MSKYQKMALKLFLLIVLGSLLGFSPTVISVTQNAQNVQAAFAAEDYQQGAEILMEMAAANPWWTSLWEIAGEAAFIDGEYSLALSAFQQARELGVLSPSGRVHLGSVHLMLGDLESAELTWQSLPDNPQALKQLAEFYESQNEFPQAIEAWYDYLALNEEAANPEQVFYFGLMIAADTPPKAIPYLDQTAPDFPQAEKVASSIRESLDQEPAYQLVSTGQALAAISYWRLAAHSFQKATQLRSDYQEAWIYWGEALQHLDNPGADPLEILEQGLSLDETSPLANLFIGIYWQRMGSHEKALEYFQVAEVSWPDQADVLVEEGKSLAALGDLEAALKKYLAAVDLQPDSDQYYRQLAEYTISYSYQIRETGLPAARFAVQLDPTDPANPTVLGKVLLELGDGFNAQKLFQGALEVDPYYAPAHFQLGILHIASGKDQEAIYYLQQAITNSSNPALIDQARRLLAAY